MVYKNYADIGAEIGYSEVYFNKLVRIKSRRNVLVWVVREVLYRCSASMSVDTHIECKGLLSKLLSESYRGGQLIERLFMDGDIILGNPILMHLVKCYFNKNPMGKRVEFSKGNIAGVMGGVDGK